MKIHALPFPKEATPLEKNFTRFLILAAVTSVVLGVLGILAANGLLDSSLRSIGTIGSSFMVALPFFFLLYICCRKNTSNSYFKPQTYRESGARTYSMPEGEITILDRSLKNAFDSQGDKGFDQPYQRLLAATKKIGVTDPKQRMVENFGTNFPEITLAATALDGVLTDVYEKSVQCIFLKEPEFLNLTLSNFTNETGMTHSPLLDALVFRFHSTRAPQRPLQNTLGQIHSLTGDQIHSMILAEKFPMQALFCLNASQLKEIAESATTDTLRTIASHLFQGRPLNSHYTDQHVKKLFREVDIFFRAYLTPKTIARLSAD